jgi:hypothetical protein
MTDDNEKFTDETFVRIYDDKTGDYWQVGPDRDSLGLCEIGFYSGGTQKPENYLVVPWAVALMMSRSIETLHNENQP